MRGLGVIRAEVTIVPLPHQGDAEGRREQASQEVASYLTPKREHMKVCTWSLQEIKGTCLESTDQGSGHQCYLRLLCPGAVTAVGTLSASGRHIQLTENM